GENEIVGRAGGAGGRKLVHGVDDVLSDVVDVVPVVGAGNDVLVVAFDPRAVRGGRADDVLDGWIVAQDVTASPAAVDDVARPEVGLLLSRGRGALGGRVV